MALNFPDSPSNEDTVTLNGTIYTYNATTTLWETITASGASVSVTVSDTAPSSPSAGGMWYNSSDLKLYVYYNDGTTSQWVIAAPAGTTGLQGETGQTGAAGTGGSPTNIVANMVALVAVTGMSQGDMALVTSLNKVFMYTPTGWFLVATMTNASPTAITGVAATYALAIDGTATVVTVASTDPEGFPLTFSHSVTTGSLGSTATVAQGTGANTNVFTITPSATAADAGTFSITFSVTDGATGAVNAISAFTLAFVSSDVRLNISSTFPGPTYPNEVPADHAVSGSYLELTQTMSNNTRSGSIDFGPNNFEEIWVEVRGGKGGKSIDSASGYSGGSGSRIRASLDLTAIHTTYGHKKINFSVGRSGGAGGAVAGKNGSGGGASAIWVWSNSNGTSGTAIPLIVSGGGGGGSSTTDLSGNVLGKDAFLPSSNMTTIQLFSHFSGFHSTVNVNSRPWQDYGPSGTGSGNGASWSQIGLGAPVAGVGTGYAPDVYSIRDQFSLNNNPADPNNASIDPASTPTFGGGAAAAYGGGGGGGYFGGFNGHYEPATLVGGMGGQSYIDTSYITLISHIVIALEPEIKIHKVNSTW